MKRSYSSEEKFLKKIMRYFQKQRREGEFNRIFIRGYSFSTYAKCFQKLSYP